MIETYSQMRCDECQESSEVFDLALFTKAQVLGMLREQGWSRRRGGRIHKAGDVCPRCNPNHQGGKAGAR